MLKIYKVLDPRSGTYCDSTSLDACIDDIAQVAFEFYMESTYGAPYSICEINENGTEIWSTPTGEMALSLYEMQKRIRQKAGTHLVSIPKTTVQVLP